MLLEAGADPWGTRKQYPLLHAMVTASTFEEVYVSLATLLLETLAKKTERGQDARDRNWSTKQKWRFPQCIPEMRDWRENLQLQGCTEIVLLGTRAIHCAVACRNTRMIRLLLQFKASVTRRQTKMGYAFDPSVLEFLLWHIEMELDWWCLGWQGERTKTSAALHEAREQNMKAILEAMREETKNEENDENEADERWQRQKFEAMDELMRERARAENRDSWDDAMDPVITKRIFTKWEETCRLVLDAGPWLILVTEKNVTDSGVWCVRISEGCKTFLRTLLPEGQVQ